MKISIRQELTDEYHLTEKIVKMTFKEAEFSDNKEHILVNKIRKSDAFIPELSLVAINQDKEIIGHILLSKIKIGNRDQTVESLALAPVSVVPGHQNKGIGSQLIDAAIEKAKEMGFHSIIVLGHSDYYPRFGFKPASLWDIKAPFEVPDEVFMALELTPHSLEHVQGMVYYSKPFEE